MSIERKRPVPVLDDILRAWAPEGTKAGDIPLDPVDFPDAFAGPVPGEPREPGFGVRASEIDTNGHVNNVNYLSWALESLPEAADDGLVLASLRGHYRREVLYGSEVRSVTQPEGRGFCHGIFARAAGSEPYLAAAAVSTWAPRMARVDSARSQREASRRSIPVAC